MADDGSAQSQTVWPLPKFYFQVKWDSEVMAFQEVSGLDIEAQIIESVMRALYQKSLYDHLMTQFHLDLMIGTEVHKLME